MLDKSEDQTAHKWKAAIGTPANLRLVDIDKDLGMPQWPAAAITGQFSLFGPADRLLVNQIYRGFRLRLKGQMLS